MANSSDVSAGDDILASAYNNLRADVLNTSTGHTHNGTDSKVIANDAITGAMLNADVVDNSTLQQTGTTLNIKASGVDTTQLANGAVDASKLGTGATFESAVTRYYSIHPASLQGYEGDTDTRVSERYFKVNDLGAAQIGVAGVCLPHGAVVTAFKAWWYRDDASATGSCALIRSIPTTTSISHLANANSNASSGYHSVEDTSISYATIDNQNYVYCIQVTIDNNDSVNDCYFLGALITYTITSPLP
jgi:hypothetical protein